MPETLIIDEIDVGRVPPQQRRHPTPTPQRPAWMPPPAPVVPEEAPGPEKLPVTAPPVANRSAASAQLDFDFEQEDLLTVLGRAARAHYERLKREDPTDYFVTMCDEMDHRRRILVESAARGAELRAEVEKLLAPAIFAEFDRR